MKSQQSKLQNRSTSSSDFFANKYPKNYNHQYQPFEHGISSYISSEMGHHSRSTIQKSSRVIQRQSKVDNQYQMFQPSNLITQNESNLKSTVQQKSYEHKDPFLNSNYDLVRQNKRDRISQKNFSKNGFGSSNKFVEFQTDGIKENIKSEYQPYSPKYDRSGGIQQITHQRKSQSSHKQNILPFITEGLTSNHQTFNNTQSLQPITFVRASSDKNLMTPLGFSTFQETSILDQSHRMLDHIYFTIAHESDLRKVFKQFAANQRQKINQRFKEIFMFLENSLNEIRINFDRKIDDAYQTLLSQLDSLKSMAQIMWKNKRHKITFSSHKIQDIPKLQKYERSSQKNKGRSQSKQTNFEFSQFKICSTESNNLLLNQLLNEDTKIREYIMARKFYDNHSEWADEIDRQKLLRDMYHVSRSIAKMMRQCENDLLDEIIESNIQKKKGLVWLNEVSNENERKGSYENPSKMVLNNIAEIMGKEFHEIDNLLEGFRASLRHKYKEI